MTDIKDGASNTGTFSEHVVGDFNDTIATYLGDWFDIPMGTAPAHYLDQPLYPTTIAQAQVNCRGLDWQNLMYQGHSTTGAPWLWGGGETTMYNHIDVPNQKGWQLHPNRSLVPPNSYHQNSGGVNLLMCDGSVRWVNNSISLSTWQAVGTMSGGEELGPDW